jgi:acetyl esterase/lipase
MKHVLRSVVLSALALVFSGCIFFNPLQTINDAVDRGGITITNDLTYGPLERQKLDVYAPKNASNAPVLLFVHGGSWRNGGREDYPFLGEAFALEGFVTVVISYRLAPATVFPGWIEDAALAVRWTKDNINRLGGDPNRVALMGHSAGAHIVVMLGLDGSYLRAVGLERNALRGVIGVAGPYDFLDAVRINSRLRETFGAESNWVRAMPVNVADGQNPSMLLLQGLRDTTVDPRQAELLQAAIKAKGGRVQVITYANLDHTQIIGVVSKALSFLEPKVFPDMLGFLRSN